MYLFISIILIAELIITLSIICLISKIDMKILVLITQTECIKSQLKIDLKTVRSFVEKLAPLADNIRTYLKLREEKIIISVIQNLLILFLLFLLKSKKEGKKYLSTIQLILALKDYWQNM